METSSVDDAGREGARAREGCIQVRMHEHHLEDHTLALAVVDNLVLVGIVEKDNLALGPAAHLLANTEECTLLLACAACV